MSIAEGDDSAIVTVQVIGDTDNEADETFFVDVANVTGALPESLQATGTILSDDFNLVPVNAIQGAGSSSPLLGQTVIPSELGRGPCRERACKSVKLTEVAVSSKKKKN